MAIRDRGSARVLWVTASGLAAAGLWLSESRTAFAAAGSVFPLTLMWVGTRNWRSGARFALVAVLMCGLAGFGWSRVVRLERDPTYLGSGFRTQFAATSLRMIAARPLYGVGAG